MRSDHVCSALKKKVQYRKYFLSLGTWLQAEPIFKNGEVNCQENTIPTLHHAIVGCTFTIILK